MSLCITQRTAGLHELENGSPDNESGKIKKTAKKAIL